MSGALPVLLLYAFVAWTATPLHLRTHCSHSRCIKLKTKWCPESVGFISHLVTLTPVITGLCLASCPSVTRRSQCTCLVRRKQFHMLAVSGLAWSLSCIALSVYSLVQKYFRPPKRTWLFVAEFPSVTMSGSEPKIGNTLT